MLSDVGRWEGSECSGRPIFIFFKKNWICAMTRHAEPNIKLLARKLPFYSDVRLKPSVNDTIALFVD